MNLLQALLDARVRDRQLAGLREQAVQLTNRHPDTLGDGPRDLMRGLIAVASRSRRRSSYPLTYRWRRLRHGHAMTRKGGACPTHVYSVLRYPLRLTLLLPG